MAEHTAVARRDRASLRRKFQSCGEAWSRRLGIIPAVARCPARAQGILRSEPAGVKGKIDEILFSVYFRHRETAISQSRAPQGHDPL